MSDQTERISVEEELAAGLTALALGELNEQEQAKLEAQLAQRRSSGGAAGVTVGSSSSADVELLANALRRADRSMRLPDRSAMLRDALESKLAGGATNVTLKATPPTKKSRRRVWIAVTVGLSLLFVAALVPSFLWYNLSQQTREAQLALVSARKVEIRRLTAENARLLAEAKRADEELAKVGAPARFRFADPAGQEQDLKLLVTPRIVLTDELQELTASGTPTPAGGADYGTNQSPITYYDTQPSTASRYVADSGVVRGRRTMGVQGVPAPNQLAAGPTTRVAGTTVVDWYETPLGRGGKGADVSSMYGESGEGMDLSGGMDGYGIVAGGFAAEQYAQIVENRFASVRDEPLSTFSIDVDTASYANARRFLSQNQRPPANAIRIEEFINYFSYDYPAPQEGEPFSVDMEVAQCLWQPAHQLVRIGLKGKEVPQQQRPASNIVFLLDVSGSMQDANKLPLLKQAMKLLTDQLSESDRVSIVTYAGNAGLALDTTNGESKQTIRDAIDALNANGSTNGSAGIQLAYEKATESFIKQGANRVILATDGDLNVGVTNDDALVELIKAKAASGVFLTVLGFGEGNLKDGKLEKLADNGNGMYAYIDSLREARKVLVEQISGSLVTIAKDVKIKVEFNPAEVAAYRLLGYENRLMSAPDFDNDAKDAGEIGAGHTVTALYEIVPTEVREPLASTAPSLKYQRPVVATEPPKELTVAAETGELLTLSLRFKKPDANESTLRDFTLANKRRAFDDASSDFRFAAAVAAFGMVLRNSEFRGNSSLVEVEQIAGSAIGSDPQGHRTELLDLVRKASTLQPQGR